MTIEELSYMAEAITAHVRENDGNVIMMIQPSSDTDRRYFSVGGKLMDLTVMMTQCIQRCPELEGVAHDAVQAVSYFKNMSDHEKN